MPAETRQHTTTIHTEESLATGPARLAALKAIADTTPRQLMHFHWQKAERLLADLEHVIRDYSDDEETSDLYTDEIEKMEASIEAIRNHLRHILAVGRESGARFQAQLDAEAAAKAAAPKLLEAPKNGA